MEIRIGNKIYSNNDDLKYKEDLERLRYLMVKLGFENIALKDLNIMWREISDRRCANFLNVPNSKEQLLEYLEDDYGN